MSDGVSKQSKSWSKIVQNFTFPHNTNYVNDQYQYDLNKDPIVCEKIWFKREFSSNYSGCEHHIPYEWLPKWCGNVQDSSARVLSIYKNKFSI